jgi:peptidoglycan-associated lipoprotein
LTVPGLPVGTYDVVVSNPDGEQSTLRSGLTVRVADLACRQETVFFAFDVSALASSARSELDGKMSCFQSVGGSIRIEGHADERGTAEYNIALGQRRADAVKNHLKSGGVSSSRMTTTSYGEERPASSGHNEGAWAKNRRAELSASE